MPKMQQNEANTYYSQIINGKKTEMYLCPQCAKEMSVGNFSFGGFGFGFPSLVRAAAAERALPRHAARPWVTLRRSAGSACAECYSFFENELRDADPARARRRDAQARSGLGARTHPAHGGAGAARGQSRPNRQRQKRRWNRSAKRCSRRWPRRNLRKRRCSGTRSGNWRKNSMAHKQQTAAISSRIRFARNLTGFPFPTRMNERQRRDLCEKVRAAFFSANSNMGRDYDYIDMDSLPEIQVLAMAEEHLISPEFARGPKGRGLIVNKSKNVSIMICEEDHLRIPGSGKGAGAGGRLQDGKTARPPARRKAGLCIQRAVGLPDKLPHQRRHRPCAPP